MVKRITKFHPLRGFNADEGVDVLLPLLLLCALTVWYPVLSNIWVLAFWCVVLVANYTPTERNSAGGGAAAAAGSDAAAASGSTGKRRSARIAKRSSSGRSTKGGAH